MWTGMIGVNGQQVVIDSSRQIVAVKLSSYPSYTDDWDDDVWWKGYEAMVGELTGRKPAPGIPPEEGVAIGSLYWGIGERHRRGT